MKLKDNKRQQQGDEAQSSVVFVVVVFQRKETLIGICLFFSAPLFLHSFLFGSSLSCLFEFGSFKSGFLNRWDAWIFLGGPPNFTDIAIIWILISEQIVTKNVIKSMKRWTIIITSIPKLPNGAYLSQSKAWERPKTVQKHLSGPALIFFGGPQCLQRWEPLF